MCLKINNKYSTFGSPMPSRSFSASSYKYGFNGKENDDEVKGKGNSLDYGARMYDSRLGRWLSCDPAGDKYPFLSLYNFVGNSPLICIDPNGKDIWIVGKVNGKTTPVKFEAGKPAPEGADGFITDAYKGIQEFVDAGDQGILKIATDDKLKLKVVETSGDSYYKGKGAGNKSGILKLNTRRGFLSVRFSNPDDPQNSTEIINPSDKRTRFSAKRVFKHELKHAVHDLINNTNDVDVDIAPIKNAGLTNREEEKTIDETDNTDGKIRQSHGGLPFETTSFDSEEGTPALKIEKDGTKTNPMNGHEVIEQPGKVDEK